MSRASVEEALVVLADGGHFEEWDVNFAHTLVGKVQAGVGLTEKARRAGFRLLRKYATVLARMDLEVADPSEGVPAPPSAARVAAVSRDRIAITVEDGRIHVRSPFRYKDVCKGVPAARWNKPKGCWTYPASPTAAMSIREAFLGAPTTVDEAFRGLVAEAERRREAQVHKEAEEGQLAPPARTATQPWLHQLRAFHFARELPATMLAMDMGTGKSKVLVDLVVDWDARRTLIVSPVSVIDVWPREFRIHAGVPVHVLALKEGSVQDRTRAADEALHECRCGRPHVVVINYEAAYREPFSAWSLGQQWDVVACDESHRIKAANGTISKYAWRVGQKAERRLALSGTPMSQTPLDVFGQYRFLDPDIFGLSYTSFSRRYATFGGYGNYEVLGYINQDELNEKFYSCAFRVDADVLDLPPVVPDVTLFCRLGAQARRLYDEVDRELFADLSAMGLARDDGRVSEVTSANVLVRLLRLQQITGGAITDDQGVTIQVDDAKERLLLERLGDYPAAEPVVVFARFVHDLDVIRRTAEATGRRYGELSGRQNDLTSDATMPEEVDLMGVQIQAGGVGIDLTRSHYGIYYSTGYSLGDYLQTRARLRRPGQTRSVLFTHLVAEDTKDVDVYEALAANQDVVDFVLRRIGRTQ